MTAALAFPDSIIVYERGFGPMDGDGRVIGVIPLSKPDEMESAIAEVIAERMGEMREREMQEMCAQVRKDEFADFVALDRERRGWRREHDAERKMGER